MMEGSNGSQAQRFLVLKAFLTRIGLLVEQEVAFDHEAVLERGMTELLLMREGYTKILAPLIWFAGWFKRHRPADLKLTPEELLLIMERFSEDHGAAIAASSAIMIRLRQGDPEAKREFALLLKVARYVSQAERRSRREKKRREGGANGSSSLQ